MCGIAGGIGLPDHSGLGDRLLEAIAHRGPDDRGVARVGGSLLLHTRLSILDLSCAGHQPMPDHPGDGSPANQVVFNGEIYNFRDLQAPLAAAGWPCRTRSDTEVLLHAYRVWGEGFVERFRGMWAFCLADTARGVAHLSRDRFGIKPLYLYRPPRGGLVFASELRAILALGAPVVPPVVNPAALESFLAQGAVQGYDTLVQGVTLLPPGQTLTVELETGAEVRRRTYWQLPQATAAPPRERAEAVARLGETVREAVGLHLVSDVPVGVFLSGGIDSAALVALATELDPGAVRTLTIGFDVPAFDESGAAAAIASRFGTRHEMVRLGGGDVLARLPEALGAMDQPTIDGINVFVVSQATRAAGLTVALSGLGSDELFGGYASFRDVPRMVRLRRLAPLAHLAAALAGLRRDRGGAKMAEAARRPADPLGMYLLRREVFFPRERRALHPLPAGVDPLDGLDRALLADLRERSRGLDPVNQVSLWELELYMRHMLLRDGDAFSMAAPIEYRVPFLDHRLAEEVFALPGRWKQPDPRPKPLLLDLVGPGVLPDSVWRAPKRGFMFPWGAWFSPGGALERVAEAAVRDAAAWSRLGMRPAGVADLWRRFRAGDRRIVPTQVLALVVLHDYAERHGLRAA